MFRRSPQQAAIDAMRREWPAGRDPSPAVRDITYEAIKRAFGDQHPLHWPDPRDRWSRIFKINPLLKRMNASGHPVPARLDLDAFIADRRKGQQHEDAGGYLWRSWEAGFRWAPR